MRQLRPAVFLLLASSLWVSYENIKAQKVSSSPRTKQPVLYLNRANSGQHVVVSVGQAIEVRLQTIGPGQYDAPRISGTAIRFEGSAFAEAADQNPGGPRQDYHFRAASQGEAGITIPHTASSDTFMVTIHVQKREKPRGR